MASMDGAESFTSGTIPGMRSASRTAAAMHPTPQYSTPAVSAYPMQQPANTPMTAEQASMLIGLLSSMQASSGGVPGAGDRMGTAAHAPTMSAYPNITAIGLANATSGSTTTVPLPKDTETHIVHPDYNGSPFDGDETREAMLALASTGVFVRFLPQVDKNGEVIQDANGKQVITVAPDGNPVLVVKPTQGNLFQPGVRALPSSSVDDGTINRKLLVTAKTTARDIVANKGFDLVIGPSLNGALDSKTRGSPYIYRDGHSNFVPQKVDFQSAVLRQATATNIKLSKNCPWPLGIQALGPQQQYTTAGRLAVPQTGARVLGVIHPNQPILDSTPIFDATAMGSGNIHEQYPGFGPENIDSPETVDQGSVGGQIVKKVHTSNPIASELERMRSTSSAHPSDPYYHNDVNTNRIHASEGHFNLAKDAVLKNYAAIPKLTPKTGIRFVTLDHDLSLEDVDNPDAPIWASAELDVSVLSIGTNRTESPMISRPAAAAAGATPDKMTSAAAPKKIGYPEVPEVGGGGVGTAVVTPTRAPLVSASTETVRQRITDAETEQRKHLELLAAERAQRRALRQQQRATAAKAATPATSELPAEKTTTQAQTTPESVTKTTTTTATSATDAGSAPQPGDVSRYSLE